MARPTIRTMRPGERESVLDLLESAFGERDVFVAYMDHDPLFRDEDFLLVVDGARPISCLQIFEKSIRLRGRSLRLGGIGSVGTDPGRRRQGHAQRLLERAIHQMSQRGMALSLLFGVHRMYAKHGWVKIPQPLLSIRRPEPLPETPTGVEIRPFGPSDLAQVRALYDVYSSGLEATTARTPEYWEGQLRYAGEMTREPPEDFWVAESGGEILAYARVTDDWARLGLEHACAEGRDDVLAFLLLHLAPEGSPLLTSGCLAELEEALASAGARVDHAEDGAVMWRVLDRPALQRIALAPDGASDSDLLHRLVAVPRAVYWRSDRF